LNALVDLVIGEYIYFNNPVYEADISVLTALANDAAGADVAVGGFRYIKDEHNFTIKSNNTMRYESAKHDGLLALLQAHLFSPVWNKLYSRDFLFREKICFPKEETSLYRDKLFNSLVFKNANGIFISDKIVCDIKYNDFHGQFDMYRADRFEEEIKIYNTMQTLIQNDNYALKFLIDRLFMQGCALFIRSITASDMSYINQKRLITSVLSHPLVQQVSCQTGYSGFFEKAADLLIKNSKEINCGTKL